MLILTLLLTAITAAHPAYFPTAHTTSMPPAHIADRATYLAELKTELTKRWPNNRPIYILFHGHSVPAGYHRTPQVKPLESYPHLFYLRLREAYPSSTTSIIVTAIGGEHAERGAARFEADVLAKNPDVITIDYSLNDRSIGLERAHTAWTSMIRAAKDAGIPVILFTPTPDTTANLDDPADPLNQHAEQVRRLAAEHHVALVDSLAAFNQAVEAGAVLNGLMSQGNHPNRAGHALVADALAEWFEK